MTYTKHSEKDIIEKGMHVIWDRWYHHTGISDILKACDISKWVFYNYFDSKEAFLKACLKHYADMSYTTVIEPYINNTSLSPLERINWFYDFHIQRLDQPTCAAQWCLYCNTSMELWSMPVFSEYLQWLWEPFIQAFTDCFREGQEQGEINSTQSPESLGEFFVTSLAGVSMKIKLQKNAEPIMLHRTMMLELLTP